MAVFQTFEMRRQCDGLVYRFHRKQRPDGSAGYQREDKDLWIAAKQDWGWVAWDDETASITGRPWSSLPTEQGDHPPQGEWISKKGNKSYVYDLVFV